MQKITQYAIIAVTALTAYLVIGYVEEALLEQTKRFSPYVATLIGMAMIVVVFVPLFSYLESFSDKVVQMIGGGSSKVFGRYGLLIFLAIALVVLFALYLDDWFNVGLV